MRARSRGRPRPRANTSAHRALPQQISSTEQAQCTEAPTEAERFRGSGRHDIRTVPTLTHEQIRTLAPDASAARSGEALADRRRWNSAGRSDVAPRASAKAAAPIRTRWSSTSPARPTNARARRARSPANTRWACCSWSRTVVPTPVLLIGHGPGWIAGPVELPPPRPGRTADRDRSRSARQTDRDAQTESRGWDRRARSVAARPDASRPRQHPERGLSLLGRDGCPSRRRAGRRLGRSVRGLGSAANSGDAWPHLLLEGVGRLHLLSEAYRRADRSPMSCGQTSARWSAGT